MLGLSSCAVVLVVLGFFSLSWPGGFEGDLYLYPDNCWDSPEGVCKLGSMLTYTSPNSKVWQTDVWSSDKAKSGTTDGATIPRWAQKIIGKPYDEAYLKAAIVHDHYCYKENHVRSWRETHRMFYDALIDLGIGILKAKTMYYAVYLRGPKWQNLVPGESCEGNYVCIKTVLIGRTCYKKSQLKENDSQREVEKIYELMRGGEILSIEKLEKRAESTGTDEFFFENNNNVSADPCPQTKDVSLNYKMPPR